MSFDQISQSFIGWVYDIFAGNTISLSFDEIYSSTFELIHQKNVAFAVDQIKLGFAAVFDEEKFSLMDKSDEEFNQALSEIANKMFSAISVVKKAFKPIFLKEPKIDLDNDILLQFRATILDDSNMANKINDFLISYAHKLPGTYDINSEKEMIELVIKLFNNSPQWTLFFNSLLEATDAYCLMLSSTVLGDVNVKQNPIIYLGVVLEAVRHEKKLWYFFPKELYHQLQYMMITSLVFDLKDEVIFNSQNAPLFAKAFFDDFSNFSIFESLLQEVFIDGDLLGYIADLMFEHFSRMVDTVARENENNAALASGNKIIDCLIIVYEKIDLFATTILRNAQSFNDRLDEFRRQIIQDERLNFEYNAARYIDRKIDLMFNDPTKEKDYRIQINQVAKIILYSLNKMAFIDQHNLLMLARLCKFAGQQYKIEQCVLTIMEPFMPPTLAEPFLEKLKTFEESEKINKDWAKEKYGDRFSVFVLPATKAATITSRLEKIKLPNEFQEWQNTFTSFFMKYQKNEHLRLRWIYEDNLVVLDLLFPRCNFQLKAPLVFVIIFYAMMTNPSANYCYLSRVTNLPVKHIEHIVKKAASKAFQLFHIIPSDSLEETQVKFNMKFITSNKKMLLTIPQFQLQITQKAGADERLQKKRLHMYQSQIIKIMNSSKTLDSNNLRELVIKELSASFKFVESDYNQAISGLISQGIIKRDENLFSYTP